MECNRDAQEGAVGPRVAGEGCWQRQAEVHAVASRGATGAAAPCAGMLSPRVHRVPQVVATFVITALSAPALGQLRNVISPKRSTFLWIPCFSPRDLSSSAEPGRPRALNLLLSEGLIS